MKLMKLDLVSELVICLPSWESVVAEAEKNKIKVKAVSVDKWWRGRSRDIAEGGFAASYNLQAKSVYACVGGWGF